MFVMALVKNTYRYVFK